MNGSDTKVTVMVSGYIESALTEEIKQKLADHGVEVVLIDDEEPEVDRAREIVFMDFSSQMQRVSAQLLEAVNRNRFPELWSMPINFAEFNEFSEPKAYKLPKYKQPARSIMRPRQSVLRGK